MVDFRVRDEIAKQAGVSPRTAQDFLAIQKNGTDEDVREVVDGSNGGPMDPSRKAEAVSACGWFALQVAT